jgi:DNA-binding response OmpR family regulator
MSLDGFELATKLREDARTSSIPVLFVSAEESHELRARALGALGYLTKPFDPSAVVSLIGRALGGTDADRRPRPAEDGEGPLRRAFAVPLRPA